jgi:hypothetical protein
MRSRQAVIRPISSVLGAVLLLLAAAAPALAGSGGTITVRLVLRGDVPPTDSFGLGGSTASGAVGIEPVYCGPQPNSSPDTPDCEAGSYDAMFDFESGDRFDFSVYRCVAGVCNQTVYEGSATVTASPQLFTVVYDYSLGAGPLLPDTATGAEAPLGAGAWAAVLAAVAALAWSVRRGRARSARDATGSRPDRRWT